MSSRPSSIVHRPSNIREVLPPDGSALYRAYLAGEPRALAFYAHAPYEEAARTEAARRAAAHPRDRDALADVLLEQNASWGLNDDVRAHIEALREPGSVAVVTGQQLGLFGGPLYTLHKALTAVRLAEEIAAETGRPAVPLFWLADEDHDFAEVRSVAVAREGEVVTITYEDARPPDENRGPVGQLVLSNAVGSALDALDAALPPGPFKADLTQALRAAWRPGARWRDAFAATFRYLTADAPLVLVSADDPRIKRLAAPLLRQEIERWPETRDALQAAGKALVGEGLHQQVAVRPVNLFLFYDGRRLALDPEGEGFALRGTAERFTRADLLALLDAHPERFSPNVVLRPIVQDALFPTAAYVAGPGEVAYFAQLKGAYERFGVPMPVVYPRASLSLVEANVGRVLDRYGLSLPDVRGDPERLHARLALEADGLNLDALFANEAAPLHAALDRLGVAASALDPSLDGAAGAARAAVEKAFGRLRTKALRVEKRRRADVRGHLDRARAALMPGGVPQERALGALGLVARQGPELAIRLLAALDLDTRRHVVLDV